MPDPITLIATAVEMVKRLRDVAQKVKDAEANNLIADLTLTLADLKTEFASLKEENLQLKAALEAAKNTADLTSQLEHRNGLYYFASPPPGRSQGPYCPRCIDADRKLMLLGELRGLLARGTAHSFRCPECKTTFA